MARRLHLLWVHAFSETIMTNQTIDRIRNRYGFTSIQTGQTLLLKDIFSGDKKEDNHHTPSLLK